LTRYKNVTSFSVTYCHIYKYISSPVLGYLTFHATKICVTKTNISGTAYIGESS